MNGDKTKLNWEGKKKENVENRKDKNKTHEKERLRNNQHKIKPTCRFTQEKIESRESRVIAEVSLIYVLAWDSRQVKDLQSSERFIKESQRAGRLRNFS